MRIRPMTFLVGIALLILAGCTTVPPVSEVPQAANAKTAAGHLLIADYFAQKAANCEAEARLHEKMEQSYRGRPRYASSDSMGAHCQELEKQLNAAAREAKALEQAHRDLGAALK